GHVGLSIVATDVGGGFSIGLGGLGYAIGLSGSWLLFTGLVGAWLSAVFLIPRVKAVEATEKLLT
ncbi:MAG: sodium:solute symporter, partial [Elusimicrobia bacterium CG_4_9_14_3_um_filter_62_55]